MSNPGYLTTSREGENRRASPSSARIVTAVSSPTPNWPMSALQPIDGTHMRAVLCRADQLSVERVIIRRASVTCSRSLTGNARALRHRPPVPSSGCTVVGSLGNRAPPRSAAATRRADARGVPQLHPRAHTEDVLRRDPRLRQATEHQQLSYVPSSRAVALGTPLIPALAAVSADSARCTTAPTRRNSSHSRRTPPGAPARPDTATLARLSVDPRPSDRRSTLIQPITIAVRGLLKLHDQQACGDQFRV